MSLVSNSLVDSLKQSLKWIEYGKPFSSFKKEGLLVPMTVIVLTPFSEAETVFGGFPEGPQLIGTVNDRGGLCDDCPIDPDAIVERYTVLFSWEALASEIGPR